MSDLVRGGSLFFSLLSSAVYAGFLGYKKWKVWKKGRKNEIFAVMTARKGGLTTSLDKVEDYDKERVVLVDEDKIIEAQDADTRELLVRLRNDNEEMFSVKFFPICKQYLEDLKTIYKKTVFIIFTSNLKLIEYLQIKPKRRLVIVPSLRMFNTMVKTLRENEVELLMSSREMLQSLPQEKTYYNTYTQLKDVLEKMVKI